MRSSTFEVIGTEAATALPAQKLIVTWQHPSTRVMSPVGILAFDGETYFFDYLVSAKTVADFRPLLGFPDFAKHYSSTALFPLFDERVLDPQRPDYERYVHDLKLDLHASPWEQLGRSGGGSAGDTLQLYPVPHYEDGSWQCRFLVNGTRYLLSKRVLVKGEPVGQYSGEALESVLDALKPGDPLVAAHESENAYSATALLALTRRDEPIGYVPDWLAREVLPLFEKGKLEFSVDQVNPIEAGWHLRILALLKVNCPADHVFFGGPAWATASQLPGESN